MITSWTSSKPVVSRIFRNIKNIPAFYRDDILEWIPEALSKLRTNMTMEYSQPEIQVSNHQAKLPCKIESVLCVQWNGWLLDYYGQEGHIHHHPESAGFLFKSIVPIYTSSGDISDGDAGRSKFPRDVLAAMDMDYHADAWYRMNGRFIQTSFREGVIKVYIQQLPRDEEGYPLVPDNEFYPEAIYRYCRMMLIEAGFEDKVFNHAMAKKAWDEAAGAAIADATFPTPDKVRSSIERHINNFFPGNNYNY